jgi:spore maturation protein CgeB
MENFHYAAAKIEDLADTVLYYVEHEEERKQIIDNAYSLMLDELKFEKSLRRMLAAAQHHSTRKAVAD